MDATVAWAAVGAIGTVAAAGIAAWAARQSRNSAKEANAAAATLATIERDRRYEELTPKFDVTFIDRGGDDAELLVAYSGDRLEYLDEVTVKILDESGKEHWGSRLPTDVTQEEAEAFVWGPWEFLTAAAVQILSNRQSRPRPYSLPTGKNWDRLPLTRTRPGRWMGTYTQKHWQQDFEGQPIRLLITCRHEGYDPWLLLKEIDTSPAGNTKKPSA